MWEAGIEREEQELVCLIKGAISETRVVSGREVLRQGSVFDPKTTRKPKWFLTGYQHKIGFFL